MRLQAPLRDEQLALLVERTHPELQDSLSTAVELGLGETRSASSTIDLRLLDRTTSIAAASVGRITMGRLFRRTHLLWKAGLSSFSIGTMAAVLILLPTVRETWVQRMVLLSNTPWPRQVTLSIADFPDGVRRVARGVDVEILVTAQSTGQLPSFVELQYRGKDGWTTHRMGTRGGSEGTNQLFTYIIKKPKEDLVIEVRGGDGRLRDLHLDVVDPPSLATIDLRMTPPQYIGGGSRPLAATRLVEVPAGSILSITAASSKPLSKASIRSIPIPSTSQRATTGTQASDATSEKESVIAQLATKPLKTLTEKNAIEKQPRDLSGTLGPVLEDCILDIEFTDTTGITNQKPIRFQLLSRPDLPPEIEVTPDGISSVITTSAAIPISGRIEDDHGLAEVTVSLRRLKPLPIQLTPNCSRHRFHSPPNRLPYFVSSKKIHHGLKHPHSPLKSAMSSNWSSLQKISVPLRVAPKQASQNLGDFVLFNPRFYWRHLRPEKSSCVADSKVLSQIFSRNETG